MCKSHKVGYNVKITYKKTSELIPYARNNKIHSERQIKLIASSIQEYGFKNPVIVAKDNSIVAGHGRIKAAELIKLDEVPCIVADDLTDAQIKAYRIADNKLAELAEWDNDMLALELKDLADVDFDIETLGFDSDELSSFTDDSEIDLDDFFEEAEQKEKIQKTFICEHCGKESKV